MTSLREARLIRKIALLAAEEAGEDVAAVYLAAAGALISLAAETVGAELAIDLATRRVRGMGELKVN